MAEIQRVKCGDKFHRIEWSADGAKFLDHRKMPTGETPCRLRYNDWLVWTTKDQVFRWISIGLRKSNAARRWAELQPEEAEAWIALGKEHVESCEWVKLGVTPKTVGEAIDFGFDPGKANLIVELGLSIGDFIKFARAHELENFEAFELVLGCKGDMARAVESVPLVEIVSSWALPPGDERDRHVADYGIWSGSRQMGNHATFSYWLDVCIGAKVAPKECSDLLEILEDRVLQEPSLLQESDPSARLHTLLSDCAEAGMEVGQLVPSLFSGMPFEWAKEAFEAGVDADYVLQMLKQVRKIREIHGASIKIDFKRLLALKRPLDEVTKYEDPNLDPKVVEWGLSLGVDPASVLRFVDAGVEAEVLDQVSQYGGDPLEITQALREGFPRPALFHFVREGILNCGLMRTWFDAGVAPGAAAELTKANISPETGSAWLLKGYDAKEAIAGVSEGKDIATMERALEGIYWNDVFRRVKGGSAVFALKGTFLIYVAIMFEELMAPRSRAMNMWGPLEDVRAVFDGGYYDKYWGDSRPRTARVVGYDTLRFVCARFGLVQPKIFKEETREDLEGDIKRWLEPIKWDEASWAACIERLKHLYAPVY